jgi:hypothetical protein
VTCELSAGTLLFCLITGLFRPKRSEIKCTRNYEKCLRVDMEVYSHVPAGVRWQRSRFSVNIVHYYPVLARERNVKLLKVQAMFISATNSGCGLHGMCIAEITSHASIVSVTLLVTLSIISLALLRYEKVQLSRISSIQIPTFMNMKILSSRM